MKRLLVLALVALLCGCGSLQTLQSIDSSVRTRVYPYPYLKVFAASMDYCNDRGFAVTMADKETGVINTDYQENDAGARMWVGPQRVKVNLNVRSLSPDSTRVMANVFSDGTDSHGRWTPAWVSASEGKKAYDLVFTKIGEKLK
jgi:hypothetical protein